MSDTAFMPGWAWGLVAGGVILVGGLLAIREPGPRIPRSGSWRGYDRRRFWPSVDRARDLSNDAQAALKAGHKGTARKALREARTALKVATYYSEGPHTEAILRERYDRVNDLEIEAGVWG